MKVFVSNNTPIKQVIIPASKSFAQRSILAATLSKSTTCIKNYGQSDDVFHITAIAKQLGAIIAYENESMLIKGFSTPINYHLNTGESGLGIRLTTAICAALEGDFTLTGTGSLLQRPMTDFEYFLPQLGVNCKTTNGFLPLTISGNATAGSIDVDGSLSSQYLSGLLMALPLLPEESRIQVNALKSKPYIDITLDVLNAFGIIVEHESYKNFRIPGNQMYQAKGNIEIEGDYSGASIWMVYGAISQGITLHGLREKTAQGDAQMLTALDLANVQYNWRGNELNILKSDITPFRFDANECPDLFPALVVLAAAAKGTTTLLGAQRLVHKESDRGTVLQKEFKKLGLIIELENDIMRIHGTGKLTSGTIDSNNDHRIAMAGGISAMLSPKGINITKAESVNKSYPKFWQHLGIL